MTGPCPFCEIAAGTLSAQIVFRDESICAFLDRGPIRPGHVQIIPHAHIPYFEELPDHLAQAILRLGQRIAKAQKRIWGVERVAFLFTGGDLAHAHAHLVPMHEKTDITSARYIAETDLTYQPCPRPEDAELDTIADKLRAALKPGTLQGDKT